MVTAVYIHIPFCNDICTYCDFCKMYFNEKYASLYLDRLEKEIKTNYHNEALKTIYIGGGTPSCLNKKQFKKLLKILELFTLVKNYEITIEINPDIKKEILNLIVESKINRISIGVQSFNKDMLNILGRKTSYNKIKKIIDYFNSYNIFNINLDLIYGINNETMDILKKDLSLFTSLNITHISTYALIKEKNTMLDIKKYNEANEDLVRKMYDYIRLYLPTKGFDQYEISNFSKKGFLSCHNLTYWHNEEYYGFGLGSSGFINNIRYENTRNLNKYLNGYSILERHKLTKKENMENEMILGLRLIRGINKNIFFKKYNVSMEEIFNISKLKKNNNNYSLYKKDLFISNEILIDFINI